MKARTGEIETNLRNSIFFHGTWSGAIAAIKREGFKPIRDGKRTKGYLGSGIYLSCNYRTAVWYGERILRVGLMAGTRILDASLPSDTRILEEVKRKYGKDAILLPPWRIPPRNKALTQGEVIALVRHHYHRAYRQPVTDAKWSELLWYRNLVRDWRTLLVRHGFHGFGNPEDGIGLVVFFPGRVRFIEEIGGYPRGFQFVNWDDLPWEKAEPLLRMQEGKAKTEALLDSGVRKIDGCLYDPAPWEELRLEVLQDDRVRRLRRAKIVGELALDPGIKGVVPEAHTFRNWEEWASAIIARFKDINHTGAYSYALA